MPRGVSRHGARRTACAQLAAVQPFHVAAFVKELQGQFAPPTVKQHLAALRMLFDWLVTGHVIDMNPAHAVRGPKYVVKKGKTPVLTADEARALLDAIDTDTLTGLRDRALIGVMVYTFARVNAVIGMKVKDYFTQGRRGWVRLHEKGGKEHEVPCHHTLEQLSRRLHRRRRHRRRARRPAVPQHRAQDRPGAGALAAGRLPDDPAPRGRRRHQDQDRQPHVPRHRHHRLPEEQGTLEHAQTIANHASPRTTKLYDRRGDEISLDEVEKIAI